MTNFTEITSRLEDPGRQRALQDRITNLASVQTKKRVGLDELFKRQRLDHKHQIFNMVYAMTSITYLVVLIVVLSQVIDVSWSWSPITFEKLSTEKFALVLSGFLAELLLLPKIILTGLFNKED